LKHPVESFGPQLRMKLEGSVRPHRRL